MAWAWLHYVLLCGLLAAGREPCLEDLATRAGQQWRICWPDERYGGCRASESGIDALVPGTVLSSMLPINFSGLEPYISKNLWRIPDIHQVGREFYTVRYRTRVPAARSGCERGNRTLLLRGINYAAHVHADGQLVAEVTGMFHRLYATVPKHAFDLEISVEPPFHPGVNATSNCGWKYCGQGGDHSLAQDGPVAQFALGWDWIQATPDRQTGLWDKVQIVEHDGLLLQDVFVETDVCARLGTSKGNSIIRSLDVHLKVRASAGPSGLHWRIRRSGSGELIPGATGEVRLPNHPGTGALMKDAELWMPWQHGTPSLHTVEVFDENDTILVSQPFGIRCVEVVYDKQTDGPAFYINGNALFLAGANWITTDQLLRFTSDAQRYEDEVRLLLRAGANVIRVWGGGIAERPEFFTACDRFGMLVYQEFWMTGDNNGQFAGEFSWPLDHKVYIDNVRDTVLMLRAHPSLFWYGGGNELWPSSLSPPPDIHAATRLMIEELDGSRPYIQTSSLLQQMKSYNPKDVLSALSVDDGPYGAQPPQEFFRRNPQLRFTLYPNRSGLQAFPLSINPEIGGPNWPTYSGLRKFIHTDVSPGRKGSFVPDEFNFHAFESFNIDITANRPNFTNTYNRTTIDPVYDLFHDNLIALPLERYTWRANLIQLVQHQLMFEGYLQHAWTWYAGLLLWKGQAPWPSLRGFVYDWYLETNAAHAGMRSALHELDHVQLDLDSCDKAGSVKLTRVNRGWHMASATEARVTFYEIPSGKEVQSNTCSLPAAPSNTVSQLNCSVRWPRSEGTFLLRIALPGRDAVEHLLSDPCNSDALLPGMDFRNLDEAPVSLAVYGPHCSRAGRHAADGPEQPRALADTAGLAKDDTQTVTVENGGSSAALLVHLQLFDESKDTEVLPVWWSHDYFTLLPSESVAVSWLGSCGKYKVLATGFNVAESWSLEGSESLFRN